MANRIFMLVKYFQKWFYADYFSAVTRFENAAGKTQIMTQSPRLGSAKKKVSRTAADILRNVKKVLYYKAKTTFSTLLTSSRKAVGVTVDILSIISVSFRQNSL